MMQKRVDLVAAALPTIRAVEWVEAVAGVRLPLVDSLRLHPGGYGVGAGLLVSGGPGFWGVASRLMADWVHWEPVVWPRGRVLCMAPPERGAVILVSGISGLLAAYRAGVPLACPIWVAPTPGDMADFLPPPGVETLTVCPARGVDPRPSVKRRGVMVDNPHFGRRVWVEAADILRWRTGARCRVDLVGEVGAAGRL